MNFWEILGVFFWTYLVCAYLVLMFTVLRGVFGDPKLNGWGKAAWIILLVLIPLLTALIYVIARGSGVTGQRYPSSAQGGKHADAGWGTNRSRFQADAVEKIDALLASGSITEAEYDVMKAGVSMPVGPRTG